MRAHFISAHTAGDWLASVLIKTEHLVGNKSPACVLLYISQQYNTV